MSYLSFIVNAEATARMTKTTVWAVFNAGVPLGEIRWYAPWRRYALAPIAGTVWDMDCLKEVTEFLGEVNARHRA